MSKLLKFDKIKSLRDRPFNNLKGGGYGFLFRSEFFFRQHESKGKWECKNDINGNVVYHYQFKKKYRINSFLMQELKLYMA
jgi:hypothetical protein